MPVSLPISITYVRNSHNYIRVGPIQRTDSATAATITSVTAKVSATTGGSAVTNSGITLSVMSADSSSYDGDFPNTVALTAGTTYFAIVTVVANSKTVVSEKSFVPRDD
jgi:hypothetical protein